ncbi:MAG: SLATT domain-containing protein [Gemmatimonadota bacterium]|nr:SLATT domain-containing protein [Gemmatimonadota bacterium]
MPVLNSRTNQVIDIIGPDRPDDYVITPSKHASEYAQSAPELARLLRSSEVQAAAELYEDLDETALEAQKRFVTVSNRARVAVLLAGLAGAMLLAAASLSPLLGEPTTRFLIILATVIGVIAGGLAAMWIHSVRSGALLERWMKSRAEAELERLRYFELVTSEQDLSEPLLQLEYFRRYHLDVQRVYYRRRGKEHAAAADRTLGLGSAAMAAGGIITALAGAFAASMGSYWASIAGIALVAQAIGAHAENQEATAQHRRNAERYQRTRHALDRLSGMLDSVRAATADGNPAFLQQFVVSVHDKLSLEHRQWVEEMNEASEAINRLEGMLEQYKAASEENRAARSPFVRVDDAVLTSRPDGTDRSDSASAAPGSSETFSISEPSPEEHDLSAAFSSDEMGEPEDYLAEDELPAG